MTDTVGFAFDFTSASSMLALKPTLALAEEFGIEVDWLPFPSSVKPVPVRKENETVAERHARVRAEYAAKDIARYAKAQGLDMRVDAAAVDSTSARTACLWANRQGVGEAFVRKAMAEFWAGRLDIEDRGALAAALGSVGAPGFADFDDAHVLAEHEAALRERGVFTLPCYLVAGQMFVGREHLPMIRWVLGGSEGPGPL